MLAVLLPAFVAGCLLALLSSPLGCVMVWRRMAFFSDSLAHGSMLGLALAASLQLPGWLGALLMALLVGFSVWLIRARSLPTDAVLAMVASVLLCLGIILTTLNASLRSQLFNLLTGDILLVTPQDLILLAIVIPLALLVLLYNWRAQILCALDDELAASNGISTRSQLALFIVILAVFCVVGLKSIGALLISAVLVIPALTARLLTHSPGQMALASLLVTILALLVGLGGSAAYDLPAGPAIVVIMGVFFLITYLFKVLRRARQP